MSLVEIKTEHVRQFFDDVYNQRNLDSIDKSYWHLALYTMLVVKMWKELKTLRNGFPSDRACVSWYAVYYGR